MLASGKHEIRWTDNAVKNLRKIYRFYSKTASTKVADLILAEIFRTTAGLQLGVEIGQQQDSLRKHKQGHRYLISRHNKIIYIITPEAVYITHVFDTRQKPSKLK